MQNMSWLQNAKDYGLRTLIPLQLKICTYYANQINCQSINLSLAMVEHGDSPFCG